MQFRKALTPKDRSSSSRPGIHVLLTAAHAKRHRNSSWWPLQGLYAIPPAAHPPSCAFAIAALPLIDTRLSLDGADATCRFVGLAGRGFAECSPEGTLGGPIHLSPNSVTAARLAMIVGAYAQPTFADGGTVGRGISDRGAVELLRRTPSHFDFVGESRT